MSHQITKVDLIPNSELSVCNVSQFDNGRVLPFEITENKEAYTFPENIRVELHCRKPDGNIVTLPSEIIADNIVTFLSTTQLTACYGKNICEIALYGPDDYLIGSGNFILEVEKSPTLGGINSTSAIHNLETQIEEITTEIVDENYYNKTEVDDLLDAKADSDSVYTIGEVNTLLSGKANASDVYTKSQTDTLLNAKADVSDLPDMTDYYTKTATDALLDDKADADTTTAALATKADKSDTYTKTQVDAIIDSIFPTKTATGVIANFDTGITMKLVSCTVAEGAITITQAGGNFFDKTTVDNGKLINGSGIETNYANWNVSDYIPVKAGAAFYLSGLTNHPNTNQDNFELFDSSKTKTGFVNVKTNEYPYTIPSGVSYVKFSLHDDNLDTAVFGLKANPAYTPYVTITDYPISDKDNIVTLAGENNLFADSGDITVQYKGV